MHADAVAVDPGLGAQEGHAGLLVLDLHRALFAIERAAEGRAAPRRAAVVQREHHVAVLRQVLVEEGIGAAGPGAGDGLRGRTAVDEHDHRILFRRVDPFGLDQAVVQGLAAGGGQFAELDRAVRGTVFRIRVRGVRRIVGDQGRQARAVGLEQFGLRRRGRVRPQIDEHLGVRAEHRFVHAGRRGEPLRLAAGQRHGVHMFFQRRVLRARDVGETRRLVHAQQRVHAPVARGQRAQRLAVGVVQVEVFEAAAFGQPQEAPVGQELQAVVQRHPGGRGFGQQGALAAVGQRGFDQFEPALVARLALEGEAFRAAPVHACEIDVRVRAQGNLAAPDPLAQRRHVQRHPHVRIAGRRVTLLDHFGAVGVDLVALLHRHRRFVDAGVGDGGIVRRPPVTRVPAHLLVGDEFGDAVADGVAAVFGEADLAAAGQFDHPQVAVAHEAHVASARRHLRIGREAVAGGELAHRIGLRRPQVVQVQLPAQREQQRPAVGRPLVFDDAAEGGDALALAPRLLLVRQDFVRQHHRRIHQQALLARGDVVLPQVQLEAVAVLALEEGDPRAVRRDRRFHQGRARQRRAAGDGFEREFLGVHGGGEAHGGEQEEGFHRRGLRTGSRRPPAARHR